MRVTGGDGSPRSLLYPCGVRAALVVAVAAGLVACSQGSQPARPAATPAATSGAAPAPPPAPASAVCSPTRPDALGPFYKSGAPTRASVGSGFVLSGVVRGADCRPLPDAVVEFWLVNSSGAYDDDHRATVPVRPDGSYRFESNRPVAYSGRPPHIHLRVSTPGRDAFVTQFYPQGEQTGATFDIVLPA